MAKKSDNPFFVLAVLNSLGFIDVDANSLQSFMKGLKTHRKLKERVHKEWKNKIIRKTIANNRENLEKYKYKLRNEQLPQRRMLDAADRDSDEESSQHPKQFLHVAEVHHRDQSFGTKTSAVGERVGTGEQMSPSHAKEKSSIKTPEATGKDRSLRHDLTAPGFSREDPGKKSRDQSRKVVETDPKKQKTIQYDFDTPTDDSDSYPQLPGQTKKGEGKDKSQARKDKILIEGSFDENIVDSNIEASDSYKTLPKPKGRTRAKDKSQMDKSKTPLKKTYDKDFPSNFELSDSYKQLPGAKEKTKSQPKSQGAGKDTFSLRKTFDKDFSSNLEASDSYKALPKPKKETATKDKSQADKSKTPQKKTLDQDFPGNFELSDSYKQLPGGKEKTYAQSKSRSAEKSTISPGRISDKNFLSNLEASDSYKDIARKPRNQDEDKITEKSRQNRTQTITNKTQTDAPENPIEKDKSKSFKEKTQQNKTQVLRRDKSSREKSQIISAGTRTDAGENFIGSQLDYSDFQRDVLRGKGRSSPVDKKLPRSQQNDPQRDKRIREQSQIISAGTRIDSDENFIESRLDYSEFQRNVTQGKSSPVERVHLDQKSSEQFSLRGFRELSHMSYDSSSSTDSSQQSNRVATDRNLVAKDRAAEKSQLTTSGFREVTHIRFDESDSESDSESNYLEQQEAIHLPDDNEMEKIDEQQKSQSSAQSTPNFREREEINYDSSSKSDSESISQTGARNKKQEIKTGKTPARPGRLRPDGFIERSHLEY